VRRELRDRAEVEPAVGEQLHDPGVPAGRPCRRDPQASFRLREMQPLVQ
jgi:hypothetical protein